MVGVLIQAVIGGITVLVDLHPAIVGGHLLISMALVAFSTWLVVRTREGDGPAVPLVDRTTRLLVRVLTALTAVVLVLGVVVTGAGPHSGDDEVGYRFDVDPWTMSKLHAASVWAFIAVLVVVLVLLHRRGVSGRPWTTGLVLLGRHARPGRHRVRPAVHRPADRPGQPAHARRRPARVGGHVLRREPAHARRAVATSCPGMPCSGVRGLS